MYLFGVETLIIDHLGKDRVEFTEPWTITIAPGGLLTITDQFVRLFRDVQSMKADLRPPLLVWRKPLRDFFHKESPSLLFLLLLPIDQRLWLTQL